MSESMYLIKPDELTEAINKYQNAPSFVGDRKFKGFLLCPTIDPASRPAMYLNPVYGDPDNPTDTDGDIIIQNNSTKACPYPPGYGS